MTDAGERAKRILKLDDLLRARHAPEPLELSEQVKMLRGEVQRLQVRQDLLAARQQQTFGMMEATKKLVREVWDWVRTFEGFIKANIAKRPREHMPGETPARGLDLFERFTIEHVAILFAAEQLAFVLSVDEMCKMGAHDRALRDLRSLADQVEEHLLVEDNVFNESLRTGDDEDDVREHMARHMGEVGALRQIFAEFSQRWTTVAQVEQAPERFVHDAMIVLDMLAYRISQEDTVLFPLIQQFSDDLPPARRDF